MNRFFSSSIILMALTSCLLSASAIHAQTFIGKASLSESPDHLEAAVFPISNVPSTIKVSFNNRTGGTVRISIRDEKGKIFYEEFAPTALYRRKFDLSPLPAGNYTVELSKKNEHFTQAFAIQAPYTSHIAMEVPPILVSPDKPADKKLVVSQ